MGRHVDHNGEVYRVVVECQEWHWYNKTIQASRTIYGPWGTKAPATRKRNEIQRRFEEKEKDDWRNVLYTCDIQRAIDWEDV